MIKLYGFGAGFGVVDGSPFVLKVDVFLRMAGLEYESVMDVGNLRKAPKGKLPFITDGDVTMGDSTLIIEYLTEKYGIDLDAHLSREERGLAQLLGNSLDEHLYWCLVYSRWVDEDTWEKVKETFFGQLPFPLRVIVPKVARRGVLDALQKQGLGRHSEEEIYGMARRSFHALADVLGDQDYFFGDRPCSFDASAFGLLNQCIGVALDNELNGMAREYENLVGYCARMTEAFYGGV